MTEERAQRRDEKEFADDDAATAASNHLIMNMKMIVLRSGSEENDTTPFPSPNPYCITSAPSPGLLHPVSPYCPSREKEEWEEGQLLEPLHTQVIRYIPAFPRKLHAMTQGEEGRKEVRGSFLFLTSYLHPSEYHASLTAGSSTRKDEIQEKSGPPRSRTAFGASDEPGAVQCGVRFPPVIMGLLAFPEVDDSCTIT